MAKKVHEELVLGKNLKKTKFKNIWFANERLQIQNKIESIVN